MTISLILSDLPQIRFYLFFLLIIHNRKEKAMSRACHFFRSGACTLDLGFLFAVSSTKRKKVIRPHHQNGYFSILPVIIPYLLLNWGLSFVLLYGMIYNKTLNRTTLKIIAAISMTVDHIGAFLIYPIYVEACMVNGVEMMGGEFRPKPD